MTAYRVNGQLWAKEQLQTLINRIPDQPAVPIFPAAPESEPPRDPGPDLALWAAALAVWVLS